MSTMEILCEPPEHLHATLTIMKASEMEATPCPRCNVPRTVLGVNIDPEMPCASCAVAMLIEGAATPVWVLTKNGDSYVATLSLLIGETIRATPRTIVGPSREHIEKILSPGAAMEWMERHESEPENVLGMWV